MKIRRREIEIFSLSFLDCICCGFGAVLLLFVLTASKRADTLEIWQAKIAEVIGYMDNDLAKKDDTVEALKMQLASIRQQNVETGARLDQTKKLHTELEERLKLLLERLAAIEEMLGKLVDKKKNIPKQEKKTPIPIVNPERRQYLTGFDVNGKRVLFLVEASAGMTSDKIEDAAVLASKSERERRDAPKWKRVKKGLQWLIANLDEESRYKIIFFNSRLIPIETDFGVDWFDPMDEETTARVLKGIEDIVPDDGANLEKAFAMVDQLPVEPDRLVLICDGLPTLSDSFAAGREVMYEDRVAMLREADKALTIRLPINTILYPFVPDPGSAVHFWRLADKTGGSLVSPSENWPDT